MLPSAAVSDAALAVSSEGQHTLVSARISTRPQDDKGKRVLCAAVETALSMLSLIAASFALWAITSQMSLTSGFFFSSGPLSDWLLWVAAALVIFLSARPLRRLVS